MIKTESSAWIRTEPRKYRGWPSVIRTKAGDFLTVYSGGRDAHVCPFGRVEMMRSKDEGRTWSEPDVLVNTPLDDRDAGILETSRGTLLVTWFTSTAFASRGLIERAEAGKEENAEWPAERVRRWKEARERMVPANCPYPEIRRYMESMDPAPDVCHTRQWLIRSDDGGRSWSEPYPAPLMSPHGPKAALDGRLLWVGKKAEDPAFIGLAESRDDGLTWVFAGRIPPLPGHDPVEYHELDLVDAEDGTLIAQIRNHGAPHKGETLQTESRDAGHSWDVPRSIGAWGFPSHLLRLPDGTLLMTYSYRGSQREPREANLILVRFSRDRGQTWSAPHPVGDPSPTWDFGYPSTAALPDGRFLTLWYQVPREKEKAQLVQAVWTIA